MKMEMSPTLMPGTKSNGESTTPAGKKGSSAAGKTVDFCTMADTGNPSFTSNPKKGSSQVTNEIDKKAKDMRIYG